MNIMRQMVAVLLLVSFAAGQTEVPSTALSNDGKQIRVPVSCTEEEIQSLGMTCLAEMPCAVYLELSAIAAGLSRITLAGNLHTESTALSSVVLTSDDNGATWTEPHPRVRQGSLDQMQFVDSNNGWISGQVLAAIPRDPFFLITDDGGKSWKQRPVFGEAHFGFIDKFLFTSPKQGKVLVDRANSSEGGRFALLETQTAGDSWSIQSVVVRAPKLDWVHPADPNWRLQTNAQAKTYRVEKKEGQGWAKVAEFLIQPGACAVKETELKAPPEPSEAAEGVKPATDAVEVFQIGGPRTPASKPKPAAKKAAPKKK